MTKALVFLLVFCSALFAQGAFTDSRDGKTYKIVKIGNQTWMDGNLEFNAAGSKCYGNEPENCAKFGRLYSWFEARQACPAGWHLPSDNEWQALVDFAGNEKVYEFLALLGGNGNSNGNFYNINSSGRWWSATEYNALRAYRRYIYNNNKEVDHYHGDKKLLLSVRCLQD